MAGFGKHSGPAGAPPPQTTPFGSFPRSPPFVTSPPPPIQQTPPRDRHELFSSNNGFQRQSPSLVASITAVSNSGAGPLTKNAQAQGLTEPVVMSRPVPTRTQSPPLTFQNNNSMQNVRPLHEMKSRLVPMRAQSPPLTFQNNNSMQDVLPLHEMKRPVFASVQLANKANFPDKFSNSPSQQYMPLVSSYSGENPRRNFATNHADVQVPKRTRSPPLPYSKDYLSDQEDSKRAALSSHLVASRKFPNTSSNSLAQQDLPLVSTYSREESRAFALSPTDFHATKRTRSPPLSYSEDYLFTEDDSKRTTVSPPQSRTRRNIRFDPADSQAHLGTSRASSSVDTEVTGSKTVESPVPKRTRLPSFPSSEQGFPRNNYSGQDDTEREILAKAKRLARFKDELSEPVQTSLSNTIQKAPLKSHDHSVAEKRQLSREPSDMAKGFPDSNVSSGHEAHDPSSAIIGFCPDMCPEQERAERERKGDLDQYERLDGDRNLTSISLAVKKYNRTAEREADLIRPMPILKKTMDYLLNLLDCPYDDKFLGLYNFLWDRMRAIRMDLRMQHLFDKYAITMLEQMIKLHIIAMHELCEYAKGEGFSEGFDAHLNIEQMNKTSVELFQLYDDHRKRGIDVLTEKEFRGYYALLKLDKHPGYKVEPAELSLDLAKMTPEIRQAKEVLFARDVARACRTGNFIAFFRLARKSSYLQACLIHAHFGKLRSQALASLHSGLQNNQGIPVSQVAAWLAMEGEDVEDLLKYHGFAIKEFDEPYMVKDANVPFLNSDKEYPLRRSKLVLRKKSRRIVEDVSSPSKSEVFSSAVKETVYAQKVSKKPKSVLQSKALSQDLKDFSSPVQFKEVHIPATTIDEEMPDYDTVSTPKRNIRVELKSTNAEPIDVVGVKYHLPTDTFKYPCSVKSQKAMTATPADTFKYPLSLNSPKAMTTTGEELDDDTRLQNYLLGEIPSNLFAVPSQERLPVMHIDSSLQEIRQNVYDGATNFEECMDIQEVETGDSMDHFDEEVAEAKLKLILRLWRRRSAKKKEIREQRQLAANAALSFLSLGPPIRHHKEEQPSIPGEFNVDLVMSDRSKRLEQSWSKLNVSKVVAAKLGEHNNSARCICWKVILSSHMDNPDRRDELELSKQISCWDAGSWLRSKLMPARTGDDDDLLISSPDLSIWREWFSGESDVDLTCRLSIVKEAKFDNLNETVAGANGILFLASDAIPWEAQKIRLHDLLLSIPCNSHLPLLILCGSHKNHLNDFSVAEHLGIGEVDNSRIGNFLIVSLVEESQQMEHQGAGYLSDDQLRKGLQWLASETPLQPTVCCVKTRELVQRQVTSSFKVLEGLDACKLTPEHCVSAINEALDQSIVHITNAAKSNPVCWPCPEIAFLEKSSHEHRAMESYLPPIGWSLATRIEPLVRALDQSKLPPVDDRSWFCKGSKMGIDIENQKSRLEDFLLKYLTRSYLMGLPLAQQEAYTMVQNLVRLELHDSVYYLVPNWLKIFRRVFNWQLINLSDGEFATAYVLKQDYTPPEVLSKSIIPESCNLIYPCLDEMVELSHSPYLEYNRSEPSVSHCVDVEKANNGFGLLLPRGIETEMVDSGFRSLDSNTSEIMNTYESELVDCEGAEKKNSDARCNSNRERGLVLVANMAETEADRLSKLLEQCNLVQNMIDKKLSIYF